MVMTNAGFDGTVDEQQFARMMNIGAGEGVDVAGSWAVTQGSGRQVSVAAQNGWAFSSGVVSRETVALTASVPTPTQGAWHLVVRRIDWTSGTSTSGVSIALVPGLSIASTTAPTQPPSTFPVGRNVNPGTLYDQPLAWVFVQSVNTTLTIFDLRSLPLPGRLALLEKPPIGRVVRSTVARTIPATTWTGLTVANEWDATSSRSIAGANGVATFNGTWVVPTTGRYTVSVQVTLNATINMFLAVKLNSTTLDANGSIILTTAAGTSSLTAAQGTTDVPLVAGDVLRVYVFLSASAAWNVTPDNSYFSLEYKGA